MKNKDMKRQQRKMNRYVREINKVIREDDLWNGRFEVKQYYANYIKYSDNSGGELYCYLCFVDKKTGRSAIKPFWVDNWLIRGHIFMAMNDFIVEYCGVWEEDPKPSINQSEYWYDTPVDWAAAVKQAKDSWGWM